MKNSPDQEWLNRIEDRLRNYTEEPDTELWDKISGKVQNQRQAVWIPWAKRTTALISLIALIGLWSNPGEDRSGAAGQSGKKKYLPEKHINNESPLLTNGKKKTDGEISSPENLSGIDTITYEEEIIDEVKIEQVAFSDREKITTETKKEIASEIAFLPHPADTVRSKTGDIGADSIKPLFTKKDSLKYSLMKTDTRKPIRKKKHLTLYATVTPSLTYQKIIPFKNDGLVISGFNASAVFSGNRLSVDLAIGVQGRISDKLEFYSGLSMYRQSQTLIYQYQSGDRVSVTQETGFDYSLRPGNNEQKVDYDMFNIGAQAGMLYHISGERLKHKLGAGLSYQHGIQSSTEGTYNNAQSQYLFYQLFYRNEYSLHPSIRIFVQPFYTHTILSKEKLDEPFKLIPYRAGIGFGVLYHFD